MFFTGGVAGGYGLLILPEYSREYLLGLLNSTLLEWYIHQSATPMRGGYYSYESRFIRHIPIRTIESLNRTEKSHHDKIVALVQQMLDLQRKFWTSKSPQTKTTLKRQIEATEQNIDQLVYDLYGLTEKEIKIVEERLR